MTHAQGLPSPPFRSHRGHSGQLVCAMPHSHMCHDSFTGATVAALLSPSVPYSFTHVPWLIHTCTVTHTQGLPSPPLFFHRGYSRLSLMGRHVAICAYGMYTQTYLDIYVPHINAQIYIPGAHTATWLPMRGNYTHIHTHTHTHAYIYHIYMHIHTYWLRILRHGYPWEATTHTHTHTHTHTYIYHIYMHIYTYRLHICYRVAKTHRIPYLYRSFSAQVTYI